MEEFSKNCGFILTCNFKNRIIEPLHSRCSVIDFRITKNESKKLAVQFLKRVDGILEKENIKSDKQVVAAVIQKYFPDWRRVLNEIQRYSATGAIDSGILEKFENVSIVEVIELCKNKKFDEIRKWVHENSDLESATVFRMIYDNANDYFTKRSIPVLIRIIADYQYKAAFVVDHEINMIAFFIEVMMEAEFL